MNDDAATKAEGRFFVGLFLYAGIFWTFAIWMHGHKTATDQLEHKYRNHYEQRLEALVSGKEAEDPE